GAPVSAAAERPVNVVLQPLPEASPTNGGWLPVNRFVQREQPVLNGGGADEPALHRVAHQGRTLPPVVRGIVEVRFLAKEQPALLEIPDDPFVRIFEPLARDQRRIVGERTVRRHRIEQRKSLLSSDVIVVGTEGGCDV